MATLPEEDRLRIHRALMRATDLFGGVPAVVKTNLKSAIDATDNWIDSNQAAYNTALPDPFRTNATLAQKTLLFCAVAAARVSTGFLRRVFGEVD